MLNKKYLGEVLSISDPDKLGKIKVNVFGIYDNLKEENIPWATCRNNIISGSSSGAGSLSLPKVGSLVEVEFDNGNKYTPKWYTQHRISNELLEKLKKDDYYENAQILCYDTELNIYIYYIKNSNQGFVIRTLTDSENSNQILITEDSKICLKTKDNVEVKLTKDNIFCKYNDSNIFEINKDGLSLGSANKSAEPAVKGDKAVELNNAEIDEMIKIVDIQIEFATTQQAATSIPLLAPLKAGYTKLLTDLVTERAKLINLKQTKVNVIKSTKVTLD